MVDFVHPFKGKKPGDSISRQELISAVRLSLCAEEEATHLYDTIAEYVDDERVKKLMKDVADEEQVHIGEFQKLLHELEDDEESQVGEGMKEAEDKMGKAKAKTDEDMKEEPEKEEPEEEEEEEPKKEEEEEPKKKSKKEKSGFLPDKSTKESETAEGKIRFIANMISEDQDKEEPDDSFWGDSHKGRCSKCRKTFWGEVCPKCGGNEDNEEETEEETKKESINRIVNVISEDPDVDVPGRYCPSCGEYSLYRDTDFLYSSSAPSEGQLRCTECDSVFPNVSDDELMKMGRSRIDAALNRPSRAKEL